LHLPCLQSVIAPIGDAGRKIEGPHMFWTSNSRTEGETKIFNIEYHTIREGSRRMRAALGRFIKFNLDSGYTGLNLNTYLIYCIYFVFVFKDEDLISSSDYAISDLYLSNFS
jgi:hypothetical protein